MVSLLRIHHLTLLLATALCLTVCGCAPKLQLLTSTSQVWHGGAAGSSGGKNFDLKFTKAKSATVVFQDLWLGERDKGWRPNFAVHPQPAEGSNRQTAHSGTVEFSLRFSIVSPEAPGNPRGGTGGIQPFATPPTVFPTDFTHGAILYLTLNGKPDTLVVEDFQVLPPLNYP